MDPIDSIMKSALLGDNAAANATINTLPADKLQGAEKLSENGTELSCVSCKRDFTIPAAVENKQRKIHGAKYRHPKLCAICYQHQRTSVAVDRRKMFEGRTVQVMFKAHVSFSAEVRPRPETGVCVAVSQVGVTLLESGRPIHDARTYSHEDIHGVSLIDDSRRKLYCHGNS